MDSLALLTCKNHLSKRWGTKWEAVTPSGRYTGSHSLYYNPFDVEGMGYECDCSSALLVLAPESQREEYEL